MGLLRVSWWMLALGLGAAALLLTYVRVVQPDAGPAVRLVSFAPIGLALWAIVWLLVALRVLSGPHRAAWSVVALLVLVPVVMHTLWLAPAYVGPRPPPSPTAQPLRVMTANMMLGEADGLQLMRTVTRADVDVLVVEEITAGLLSALEGAGLQAAFPYRAGEAADGAGGSMIFSSHELTDPVRLATRWGSWSVELAAPDGPLRLIGTHPQAPMGTAQGWRDDLDTVHAAAADADLVLGDFNATLDHAPLRALESLGLRDALQSANAGWSPTWPTDGAYGLPVPPLIQIDHVFVGRRLAVISAEVVDLPGSDHAGVLAEVALR